MAILTQTILAMTELYVLRHGNTFDKGDVITRVGARTDLPLSTSGKKQASQLAAHFAAKGIAFKVVYASPLRRAVMTAEAIAGAINPPPLLRIETNLTEIDYGPDENQPEEKVVERIGQPALDAWNARASVPPGWQVDPGSLIDAWRGFFGQIKGEEGPVLAVTSNGVARFCLDAADNGEADFPRKLATAAWGRVAIDDHGKAHVASWNETVPART